MIKNAVAILVGDEIYHYMITEGVRLSIGSSPKDTICKREMGNTRIMIEYRNNIIQMRSNMQNKEPVTLPKGVLNILHNNPKTIIFVNDEENIQTIKIDIPENKWITIGRNNENDIQIKSSFISRKHMKIMRKNDQLIFIDTNSKNGIYYKGKLCKEGALSNEENLFILTLGVIYQNGSIFLNGTQRHLIHFDERKINRMDPTPGAAFTPAVEPKKVTPTPAVVPERTPVDVNPSTSFVPADNSSAYEFSVSVGQVNAKEEKPYVYKFNDPEEEVVQQAPAKEEAVDASQESGSKGYSFNDFEKEEPEEKAEEPAYLVDEEAPVEEAVEEKAEEPVYAAVEEKAEEPVYVAVDEEPEEVQAEENAVEFNEKAEEIPAEVPEEEYVEEAEEEMEEAYFNSNTLIFGVASALNDVGKTSIALALCELLAEEKKVLYINAEAFQTFSFYMDHPVYLMDRWMDDWSAKMSTEALAEKLETAIEEYQGVDYLKPFANPRTAMATGVDFYKSIVRAFRKEYEYDYIFVDMGDMWKGDSQELLKMFDYTIMVSSYSRKSVYATNVYYQIHKKEIQDDVIFVQNNSNNLSEMRQIEMKRSIKYPVVLDIPYDESVDETVIGDRNSIYILKEIVESKH